MPRQLRAEQAGGIHHVTARGVARQLIFADDVDRRLYLAMLGRATRFWSWRCLSYCLMGNHVHLLIETPKPNLGRGVQRLHSGYARAFNDRHKRSGHLFQGRFHSELVTTDAQLWATVRYVVANPVEAGLCAEPRDWEWSSHAGVLDGTSPPWLATERLWTYLAAFGGDPVERYAALVKGSDPLSSAA